MFKTLFLQGFFFTSCRVAGMEQNSEAGEVNIGGSAFELVKDKFSCTHRGKIQAKNKRGLMCISWSRLKG
jgi:hypothetical protein